VGVSKEGVGVANNPKMGWSCHRVRFPRSRISPGDARVNSHDARLVKIGGVLIAVGAILGIARPTAELGTSPVTHPQSDLSTRLGVAFSRVAVEMR
jgi:hypothetical protein